MVLFVLGAVIWILFSYGTMPQEIVFWTAALLCVAGTVSSLFSRGGHAHHVSDVDHWARLSHLQNVSPQLKCTAALIVLFGVLLVRSLWVAAFVAVTMCLLTVWAGRVPMGVYLHLLKTPLLFLLVSGLALLLDFSSAPAGVVNVPFGGVYLCVTQQGRQEALVVLADALAAVSCLLALALSTPLYECARVLRKAKVPGLMTELMFFIYRYLFVLSDCLERQKTAAAARLGFWGAKTTLRSTGGLMLSLLIGSMHKASSSFDAMESRCYQGELVALRAPAPLRGRHIGFTLAYMTAAVLLFVWERMWLL